MPTTGVILGRFMPPHRGHEYLVNFAASFVDELWIFVCTLPHESIPGEIRFEWMKNLFPKARLVHIQEVNPSANRAQANAHQIWAKAVLGHMPAKPDYVFASEDYGWAFARELGARFIPVDPSRDQFPISGTEVRTHPFRYWHFIPEKVRPWFIKHIQIQPLGELVAHGEDLLRTTAMLLQTIYVPDYATFYHVFSGAADHPLDATTAIQAQTSMVRALSAQARFFLLRLKDPVIDQPEPDLLITLSTSSGQPPTLNQASGNQIHLQSRLETLPYCLRDAILDRYRDYL